MTIFSPTAYGGSSGQQPQNPLTAPELNKTIEVSMERRNGDDNYKEACLFLNDSFKEFNTCALLFQNSADIVGTQDGEL